jgi:hypothetical protein
MIVDDDADLCQALSFRLRANEYTLSALMRVLAR